MKESTFANSRMGSTGPRQAGLCNNKTKSRVASSKAEVTRSSRDMPRTKREKSSRAALCRNVKGSTFTKSRMDGGKPDQAKLLTGISRPKVL